MLGPETIDLLLQGLTQAGGRLLTIGQDIIGTAMEQARIGTQGRFGQIVWPGALRRLARHFPGWDR